MTKKLILFLGIIFLTLPSFCFGANYGLQFNGIDNYVLIPHSESLNFGTEDLRFEARFKPIGDPLVNRWFYLFSKIKGDWDNYIDLEWQEFDSGETSVAFYLFDGTNFTWTRPEPILNLFPLNAWYKVIAEREGEVLRIYKDDNLVAEETFPGIIADIDTTVDIFLGAETTFTYMGVNGIIDYLKFYKNDDLIAYWNFNEGTGTTAYDLSGYENDGEIFGAEYVLIEEAEAPTGRIFTLPTNLITSTMAFVGDLIDSIWVVIILAIAIPLGFYIIPELYKLFHTEEGWKRWK